MPGLLDLGALAIPGLGRLGGRMGARTPPFMPGRPGAQKANPGAVSGAPPTPQQSTSDTMQDGVPPVGTGPAVNSSAQSPDYDEMGSEVTNNNIPRAPSLLHQDQRTEASRSLPTSPSLLQPGASASVANARDQRLLEIMDNPPQPRGGVAGKLGGFFNALGWNQIGDPLKNPGLGTWQANLARAQAQADIGNRAALRDRSIAAQQAQVKEAQARIDQQNLDNQRTTYSKNMEDITKAGGFEAPTVPPSVTTSTIPADTSQPLSPQNLPMSQRLFSPGLQPQQSSGLGTVQKLTDPDTGQATNMVRPNMKTQQEMKAAGDQELTGDLATYANLPPGTKVPAPIYAQYVKNYQASKKTKAPTAAEAQDQFQSTIAKLASTLPPGAITDVNQQIQAIRAGAARGVITADEANNAIGFLATRATPASTGTTAVQRTSTLGRTRMYSMLDTQNGNRPVMVSATDLVNDADTGRYITGGLGAQSLNKTALMEDIRSNINQTRESLRNMPELSPATRTAIAIAMRDRNPRSALQTLFTSGAIGTLGPQEQEYLMNIAQLQENMMALRPLLGAGQGSEDLRAAIFRTIPGPTSPNNEYSMRQLDLAEKTVDRLKRGVPNVPLRPQGGGGGPAAAPGRGAPAVGTVVGGYRFNGGDPNNKSNWSKQ